jgi:cell wall-associated NlpC family hydrolase
MTFATYKHLLGRPYVSGRDDCYGLARNYYRDLYGIEIIDAARPEGWWNETDINLIDDFMEMDGWEQLGTNTRALKVGDGLIFSLINGKANHVGIYVGNGTFIHHVWRRYSSEDALIDRWKARLLMIVRHPEVAKRSDVPLPQTSLESLMPEWYRARFVQPG